MTNLEIWATAALGDKGMEMEEHAGECRLLSKAISLGLYPKCPAFHSHAT